MGLEVVWVVMFKVVWLFVVTNMGFYSLIWDLNFVFDFSENIGKFGLRFVFGYVWGSKIRVRVLFFCVWFLSIRKSC